MFDRVNIQQTWPGCIFVDLTVFIAIAYKLSRFYVYVLTKGIYIIVYLEHLNVVVGMVVNNHYEIFSGADLEVSRIN